MSRKSMTCIGKVSKAALTEYDSEAEALEGAQFALARHAQQNVPYCCKKCGLWHLSPASRQTPSTTCGVCQSREGRPKATYPSQRDAERRAEILRREQGLQLRAYPCDEGGWHLTKG